MDVYSSDGSKIGAVAEVYGSEYGGSEPGTAPPQGTLPTGAPIPFLKVDRSGVFGLGAAELYVPAAGVQEVAGDRVVLSCAKNECEGLFPGRK
jgi:hypothetical protein